MDSGKRTIVLKSTGAIGDLVIASALVPELNLKGYDNVGIISKPFTLPLWKGLENTSTYPDESSVPKDAPIVDISDYLSFFPHSTKKPTVFYDTFRGCPELGEPTREHLSKWMFTSFLKNCPNHLLRGGGEIAQKRYVRVVLTPEEKQSGADEIEKCKKDNGSKPVVVFAPYSTTKNKNLPRTTLETVVKAVSDFAVPCLLEPFSPEQYIEGTTPIGDKDLRKSSAILYAADACVVVDSAPLHMVNGVIHGEIFDNTLSKNKDYSELLKRMIKYDEADNGCPVEESMDQLFKRRNKVIVILGSSAPEVVAYKGNRGANRIIHATGGCDISPCGAHGYLPIEGYSAEFQKPFYPSGTDKDKSGCVFADYSQINTARCLEAISADEIIETIRQVVK
jgi:hypothetical protein